jgi:hypothetical protein
LNPNVHIQSRGNGMDTVVTVDGVKVRGITRVTWDVRHNERAKATIELYATLDAHAALHGVIQHKRRHRATRRWWQFWKPRAT